MKRSLQAKDIVNLEYFFHRDAQLDMQELQRRDRSLGRQLEGDSSLAEHKPLSAIIAWIEARVSAEFGSPEQKSPGEIFAESIAFGYFLTVVIGLVLGILAGLAFFSYSGTTPVNVFSFLLLFVASQIFFVILFLLNSAIRRLLPGIRLPSLTLFLFRSLSKKIVARLQKSWSSNTEAGQRSSARYAFGIFSAKKKIYGSLFYWPLFCLAQLFGISFNLGLLATTLLKVTTSDLAFGWQSTIQFSDTAILKLVEALALPWSWFAGDWSHPDLTEIAGSRIILKDGIYNLSTSDLIAWWPFLVMCLLCYGLLVRLGFYVLGSWLGKTAAARFTPNTPECLALLRRITTPAVTTQAPAEHLSRHKLPDSRAAALTPLLKPDHLSPQLVLVPDDIIELLKPDELQSVLQPHGLLPGAIQPFLVSYDDDQQLLEGLTDRDWLDDEGLCLVMEGWMVPLEGFLSYLRQLREAVPGEMIITLGLIGRPAESIFTEPKQQDFALWKKKLGALGDPHLQVLSLIKSREQG